MLTPSLSINPNVGLSERIFTAIAAAGLFALAMKVSRAKRGPLRVASTALLLRSATGYCPAYAAAGVAARRSDTREALAGSKGEHLDMSVTIAQPPAEVYALWRDVTQLAKALPDTVRVDAISDTESYWRLFRGALPPTEWTARIINDVPGRLIAWKTIGDADVVSAGSVRFTAALDGRGTTVHVRLQYSPPFGRVGAGLASAFGNGADAVVRQALQDIKQFLEQDGYAGLEVE